MTTVTVEQERLVELLDKADLVGLRRPVLGGSPSEPERTLTWTPDLSPNEVLLARAIAAAVRVTVAERNALEADMAGLRQYNAVATPTLAQTAAATKAQNRLFLAIFRD